MGLSTGVSMNFGTGGTVPRNLPPILLTGPVTSTDDTGVVTTLWDFSTGPNSQPDGSGTLLWDVLIAASLLTASDGKTPLLQVVMQALSLDQFVIAFATKNPI